MMDSGGVLSILFFSIMWYSFLPFLVPLHSKNHLSSRYFTIKLHSNTNKIDPSIDPPFFPLSIEELAQDISYNIKMATSRQLSRIRIDTSVSYSDTYRHDIKFLILLVSELLDNKFLHIRIFIDEDIIPYCQSMVQCLSLTDRIHISGITQANQNYHENDSLYIVFQPNNILYRTHNDDVQLIAFRSAINRVPIVLVNPQLVSSSWSGNGVPPSFLVADFYQTYYICDRFMRVPKVGQFYGLKYQLFNGAELYSLQDPYVNGSKTGKTSRQFTRLATWPSIPSDLRSQISRILVGEFNYFQYQSITYKSGNQTDPFSVSSQKLNSISIMNKERTRGEWHDIVPR